MKPESSHENPEQVRKLLSEWQVTSSLPARFAENVWRRIENAERAVMPGSNPTPLAMLKAWIAATLPRPAFAVAYISVLLITGLLAGYWHAQVETTNWDKSLASRYVQTVDPLQRLSGN